MIYKAGCIVISKDNPSNIVLIHRKEWNDFSFPKGHIEAGESSQECAIREVKEEVGLDIEISGVFGIFTYLNNRQEEVHSVYYIAHSLDDSALKAEVNCEALYVKENEVAHKISYGNLKDFYLKNRHKLKK